MRIRNIIIIISLATIAVILISSYVYPNPDENSYSLLTTSYANQGMIVDGIFFKRAYEARDPDTGNLIAVFKTLKYSLGGDKGSLTIIFQGYDLNDYYVYLDSIDDPNSWLVYQEADFGKSIPIKKVNR